MGETDPNSFRGGKAMGIITALKEWLNHFQPLLHFILSFALSVCPLISPPLMTLVLVPYEKNSLGRATFTVLWELGDEIPA